VSKALAEYRTLELRALELERQSDTLLVELDTVQRAMDALWDQLTVEEHDAIVHGDRHGT
jgi:hypothetical protein